MNNFTRISDVSLAILKNALLHSPPPYLDQWGASPTSAILCTLLIVSSLTFLLAKKPPNKQLDHPPVVHLSNEDIFENPAESYAEALRKHGSVIGVRRKGRLEYIVGREHTRQVLTDDKTFSFELGVAKILNLKFLLKLCRGSFFKDMDHLVNDIIIANLPAITNQVYPFFRDNSEKLLTSNAGKPIDAFHFAHETVAQAMIALILGKDYITPQNQDIIIETASGIAELTGMFQNQAWFARTFPFVWRVVTWCKIIVYKIGFKFMSRLGFAILADLDGKAAAAFVSEHNDNEEINVLTSLARENARPDGSLPFLKRLWILSLLLGLIFASVHQTATVIVWVLFELAKRPEYLPTLREELESLVECDPRTGLPKFVGYEDLRAARHLDSFIREVMRTKGDTLSTVRITTTDAPLGGYVIPQGYPVIPLTTLSHAATEFYGPKATVHDGLRWVEEDKPASMTGPGYLAFGLGRWACPGRMLAVAEIKMSVLALILASTPELEGGQYRIVDKLNITSVPPQGLLRLRPLTGSS